MFLPCTEISVMDFNISSIAKHVSLTAFHIGLYLDVFTYKAVLLYLAGFTGRCQTNTHLYLKNTYSFLSKMKNYYTVTDEL